MAHTVSSNTLRIQNVFKKTTKKRSAKTGAVTINTEKRYDGISLGVANAKVVLNNINFRLFNDFIPELVIENNKVYISNYDELLDAVDQIATTYHKSFNIIPKILVKKNRSHRRNRNSNALRKPVYTNYEDSSYGGCQARELLQGSGNHFVYNVSPSREANAHYDFTFSMTNDGEVTDFYDLLTKYYATPVQKQYCWHSGRTNKYLFFGVYLRIEQIDPLAQEPVVENVFTTKASKDSIVNYLATGASTPTIEKKSSWSID